MKKVTATVTEMTTRINEGGCKEVSDKYYYPVFVYHYGGTAIYNSTSGAYLSYEGGNNCLIGSFDTVCYEPASPARTYCHW